MDDDNKFLVLGIVIVLIIIVIGTHLGYKGYLIFSYESDKDTTTFNNNYINALKKKNATIFLHQEEDESKEYLTYQNMRIRNDFSDFIKKNDNTYVLNAYDNNVYIMFNIDDTLIDKAKSLENEYLDQIIKENNLINDFKLLEYIANNYSNPNFLNSIDTLKEKNALKQLISVIALSFESITYLDGTYQGYILNNTQNDLKIAYFIKNNKAYVFTFSGLEYFNDDYIKELLETVVIK